jgi:hypothetical protein
VSRTIRTEKELSMSTVDQGSSNDGGGCALIALIVVFGAIALFWPTLKLIALLKYIFS